MELYITLFLTFLIGVLASFIGAIVGGGGLLSIPFLMFIGLPPQTAIATNKFGSVGLSMVLLLNLKKKIKLFGVMFYFFQYFLFLVG